MEQVTIFKVGTQEAVQSVGDLRENIRKLNAELNATSKAMDGTEDSTEHLTIGTQAYKDKLKELEVNQAALRNAMNGTSASMEDVVRSAKGVGTTYNSLVSKMKEMKQEIRNVDVSTVEGRDKFKEMAESINIVNDQLKAMDADMGNYQRNVGNYKSAFDGLSEVSKNMPPFLNKAKNGIDNVDKSMKLMSTNPVFAISLILSPLIGKIVEKIKESKNATDAVKRAMDALKPVMNVLSGLFEKMGEMVGRVVDWFIELMQRSKDTMATIVAGAVGVGNAILQFMLTPIRTVVDAFKGLGSIMKDIFTGNWGKVKEDAALLGENVGDAFKKGFSFAANFKEGKQAAEQFLAGIGDGGKKAKSTGSGIGKSMADGIVTALDDEIDDMEQSVDAYIDALNKANEERRKKMDERAKEVEEQAKVQLRWNSILAEDEAARAAQAYEIQRAANEQRLALLNQFIEDAEAAEDFTRAGEARKEALALEVQMEQDAAEERLRIQSEAEKKSEEIAKKRVSIAGASLSAISGVLGQLAEAYENAEEGDEKAAKKAKVLRIGEAVINTISGALAAYTSAQSLGVPFGPIIGAINAATVTAAGIAQIAKIKSTSVGSGGSSGGGGISTPTTVSAPSTPVNLPEVRNVTTASEEERLDRMASDQKVYILNSDLEANTDYHRTQVAEATF